MNKFKSPISDLKKAIQSDEGYKSSWIANLSMAFYDNANWYCKKNKIKNLPKKHLIAITNNSAEYFINLLFK